MKKLIGVRTKPPKVKVERTPHWWAGILTLCVILSVGTVISFGIQTGIHVTSNIEPKVLYGIFFTLGFAGMSAGSYVEMGYHLPEYRPLHQRGEEVCFIVNAIVWSLLILWWVRYHGDDRIKR